MAVDDLKWGTLSAWGVFIAFTSVAIWSSIPLTMRLFVTFKRFRGLYFWAILVTTWQSALSGSGFPKFLPEFVLVANRPNNAGKHFKNSLLCFNHNFVQQLILGRGLTIRAIAEMLHYLVSGTPWIVVQLMAQGGWMCMVTGFALTLYSRLNLILETRRWILWIIIFNAAFFETFMASLSIGMAALSAKGDKEGKAKWNKVFHPMERITILVLFAQECMISFIYIWSAYQYLKARFGLENPRTTTRTMILLFLVQIVVLMLDISIIVIDFLNYNTLKLFLNSWVYAFKLELEFIVLNQLVEMSQIGIPGIRSASKAIKDYRPGQGKEKDDVPDFITVVKMDSMPSPHYSRVDPEVQEIIHVSADPPENQRDVNLRSPSPSAQNTEIVNLEAANSTQHSREDDGQVAVVR